ncbi:hypothetical protein LP420_22155 [Massilia sp. B-10]|nr:hypothetical protein LP420_22155 [Massilia sp. B-10]
MSSWRGSASWVQLSSSTCSTWLPERMLYTPSPLENSSTATSSIGTLSIATALAIGKTRHDQGQRDVLVPEVLLLGTDSDGLVARRWRKNWPTV